jgi:hypothetical protein
MRALCLHLKEAPSMFQLSHDPRTFFAWIKPSTPSLVLRMFVKGVSPSCFLR